MKKFLIILAVALTVFVISGCASLNNNPSQFVSTGAHVRVDKVGEQSNTVWFGIFGTLDFPRIDQVAKANGISQIATVERYKKIGVFGLWTTCTTIVTGN